MYKFFQKGHSFLETMAFIATIASMLLAYYIFFQDETEKTNGGGKTSQEKTGGIVTNNGGNSKNDDERTVDLYLPEDNNRPLILNSVMLNHDKTVLNFVATSRMNACISMSGKQKSFLENNGNRYFIQNKNNIAKCYPKKIIEVNQEFSLEFPPLPKGTKEINFYEGECGFKQKYKCWSFKNINIGSVTD